LPWAVRRTRVRNIMLFERMLRPTNRRVRLMVGLFLAGLFCIQCTQSARTEYISESKYVLPILDSSAQAGADDLPAGMKRLAETDHIALLELCLENYHRRYSDYTCTLIKQERIGSKLRREQAIAVKFMDSPFSVAMKWLRNPPAGDRILYVEGKYNNEMLVRPTNGLLRALVGGTARRAPDGADAMRNTLRPVNMFGFKRSMQSLLGVYRQAKKNGHLKQAFGGRAKVAGRKSFALVRYLPPMSDYPAHKTVIHIDQEYLVPTCIEAYDWQGRLSARYVYKDLRFNVSLRADDFLPEANDMKLPR